MLEILDFCILRYHKIKPDSLKLLESEINGLGRIFAEKENGLGDLMMRLLFLNHFSEKSIPNKRGGWKMYQI